MDNKDSILEITKCEFEGDKYISNILEEKTNNTTNNKINIGKSEILTLGIG